MLCSWFSLVGYTAHFDTGGRGSIPMLPASMIVSLFGQNECNVRHEL